MLLRPLFDNIEFSTHTHVSKSTKGGRTRALTSRQHLLITLVWLRIYLIERVLAWLFGISQSRAHTYIRTGLDALYEFFNAYIDIPEYEERILTAKEVYVSKGMTDKAFGVGAMDGVEQAVLVSSDHTTALMEHSGKKGYATFSKLVLVNLQGKAIYKTPSMSGSLNDISITSTQPVRAMLCKFCANEVIILDSGFKGIANSCPDCACKFVVHFVVPNLC